MSLERRTLETVRRHRLTNPGDRVAVAVSGGVDSVVLLHVLWRLRRALGISLCVATFDHRLRTGSADEVVFVRRIARELGVPHYCGRARIPPGRGPEAAARAARFDFLRGVPASTVALGHHRGDQAETVLLRILRGTGLDGLSGMAHRRGRFVRPLLHEPREHLVRYARREGLAWCEDPSNTGSVFERNRVRHRAMPVLDGIHGGAEARLAGLAHTVADDLALLRSLEEEAWRGVHRDGRLDRAALRVQPPALRARLVRRLVRKGGGMTDGAPSDPAPPSREKTRALVRLALDGRPGSVSELGGGWRFAVGAEGVYVLPPLPRSRRLAGRGCCRWGIYELHWRCKEPAPRIRVPRAGEQIRGSPLRERLRAAGVDAPLRDYHPVLEGADGRRLVPLREAEWMPGSWVRITPAFPWDCPGEHGCVTL